MGKNLIIQGKDTYFLGKAYVYAAKCKQHKPIL